MNLREYLWEWLKEKPDDDAFVILSGGASIRAGWARKALKGNRLTKVEIDLSDIVIETSRKSGGNRVVTASLLLKAKEGEAHE